MGGRSTAQAEFPHRPPDLVVVGKMVGEGDEAADSRSSTSARNAMVDPKHGLAMPIALPITALEGRNW